MGLSRKTLFKARWLAPRFISSNQAASACGALPAHSDICALRSSHSALCGSAISAASLTNKAAFNSPAAAKVSQASCRCSAVRVLASRLTSAVRAITLCSAAPASRGSPAPKASCAMYHQAPSPGGSGAVSRSAACQALRESPVANKACTPLFNNCKRASTAVVLRRAAKNKSLAKGRRPAASASVAPRANSGPVADRSPSKLASSASCMAWICCVRAGWLLPNIAASALAVLIDAKTCVALLALSALRFKRASNSVAAWRMSASLPASMAWPSCACHKTKSQRFQSAKPTVVVRASGNASASACRAWLNSPPPSSFSTSSKRRLKSLGSVRMMLRK